MSENYGPRNDPEGSGEQSDQGAEGSGPADPAGLGGAAEAPYSGSPYGSPGQGQGGGYPAGYGQGGYSGGGGGYGGGYGGPGSSPNYGPMPGAGNYNQGSWGGAGVASADEKLWGMLSHAGAIVAAMIGMVFVASLVIFLVKGNESQFVRRHAAESLNFQLTALILLVVGTVVGFITLGLGFLLFIPYGIFWVIVIIMASMKANNGEEYRYPLTFRFVS